MRKRNLCFLTILVTAIFLTGEVQVNAKDKLDKKDLLLELQEDKNDFWDWGKNGLQKIQISPQFRVESIAEINGQYKVDNEELNKVYGDSLFDRENLKYVTRFISEVSDTTNDNLTGFDQMINLKCFSPDGGNYIDLRPLQTLNQLEELSDMGITDKSNLNDFYLLDNLKRVDIWFNSDEREIVDFTKPNALIDISALSDKKKSRDN